jgi:hypothetical protein
MRLHLALLLAVPLALAACRADTFRPAPASAPAQRSAEASTDVPVEERARPIPLAGPLASSHAEISGLAWHGDRLVLLPQYPGRFAVGTDTLDMAGALRDSGSLFTLTAADLSAVIDGARTEPLRPRAVPFAAPGVAAAVPGFEGYEAIAFRGDRVFVLAESAGAGATHGYLVAGAVTAEGGVRLDAATVEPLPAQSRLDNLSYETLLATPDGVIALQEANGAAVNPTPEAFRFDAAARPRGSLRVPTLEYRLTDATEIDADGRFWVMNFFYPGDRALLRPGPDSLGAAFGRGPTHRREATVERLVEFHLSGGRIERTGRAPIQLELLGEARSRNWEGVARLGTRGFLVATDTYPETLLAFVPAPVDTTRHGGPMRTDAP